MEENRYLRSAAQRGLISHTKNIYQKKMVGNNHGFPVRNVPMMLSAENALKGFPHPPRRKPWQQLPSERLKLRSNWQRLQQKRQAANPAAVSRYSCYL